MIKLTFLEDALGRPIAKRFYIEGGEIKVQSYPNIYRCTSHDVLIDDSDINAFHKAIIEHARAGNCLLKGNLTRPIEKESRKGLADRAATTQWLCLDIDHLAGFVDPEAFIRMILPEDFHDVSYVWQESASAQIKDKSLRGHLFFLCEPAGVELVKGWLKYLNMQHEMLSRNLALNGTGMGLIYGLDLTTCQNDKLLFIAPPIVDEGVTDPFTEETRYRLVEKTKSRAPMGFLKYIPLSSLGNMNECAVARLRAEAGFPKKKIKTTTKGEHVILENPDEAVVTEWRITEPQEIKFYGATRIVQFNINGGDSWGYWVPLCNIDLVHNFKSEPKVRTVQLSPEFYQTLANLRMEYAADAGGATVLFNGRDARSAQYFNGVYTPSKNQVDLFTAKNKQQMIDWMEANGTVAEDPPHDWTIEFAPDKDELFDFENRWINTYNPTEIMLKAKELGPLRQPPRRCEVIMRNICGDQDTYAHFINWLGHKFQFKNPVTAMYVFTGTQGTGKNMLFEKIIGPVLGEDHARVMPAPQIMDNSNLWQEKCLLVALDESELPEEGGHIQQQAMNRIKSMTGAVRTSIRRMYTDHYAAKNWLDGVVFANNTTPVKISEGDRRFNVAPECETKLVKLLSSSDLDTIEDEQLDFARWILHLPVDKAEARRVLENKTKDHLRQLQKNSIEEFVWAVQNGDLEHFTEYLDDEPNDKTSETAHFAFCKVVKMWLTQVDQRVFVPNKDLRTVFRYLSGKQQSPSSFGKMMGHKGLRTSVSKIGGVSKRGVWITWKVDDGTVDTILGDTSNVKEFKRSS